VLVYRWVLERAVAFFAAARKRESAKAIVYVRMTFLEGMSWTSPFRIREGAGKIYGGGRGVVALTRRIERASFRRPLCWQNKTLYA